MAVLPQCSYDLIIVVAALEKIKATSDFSSNPTVTAAEDSDSPSPSKDDSTTKDDSPTKDDSATKDDPANDDEEVVPIPTIEPRSKRRRHKS